MDMKKFVSVSALALASVTLFSGCAQHQHGTHMGNNGAIYKNGVVTSIPIKNTYRDQKTGHTVIEKHYIYTPDVNLKEAVVILMKKVDILERRSSVLPNKKDEYIQLIKKQKSNRVHMMSKSGTYGATKDTLIYSGRAKTTQKLATLPKGTEVLLKKCDSYGWCAIEGQEGYAQAWKFKKVVK